MSTAPEPPMEEGAQQGAASLFDLAGVTESLELAPSTESAWIEVIHKMESVYADLVHYQVELEEKNSALEEAQQFIGSVLSSMTDVLIVCDTEGTVLEVNAALEKVTGKPSDAFLARPLSQVVDGESVAMVEKIPERIHCRRQIECEVNLICADGSTTPLAMNCSPRYDHNGALVGAVLIGRPVGELRRAYDSLNTAHRELQQTQRQLVHSEKMASLGRLVAGVAHELNNPISFVYGNMHALKRYGARIAEYLQQADAWEGAEPLRRLRRDLKIDRIVVDMEPLIDGTLEGAERVSDIVQELRRYSGGQKEPRGRFDLPSAIRKAVQWVIKAGRVKPQVSYELPESLEYDGYQGALHQILVNLVQNAVDAMGRQPKPGLTLRCFEEGGEVKIQVSDRGPGIPEEMLPHLFDPFFTSKPVGQGTGLGLYISYGLAQELGGNLGAANGPRGGAVFTLTLPWHGD